MNTSVVDTSTKPNGWITSAKWTCVVSSFLLAANLLVVILLADLELRVIVQERRGRDIVHRLWSSLHHASEMGGNLHENNRVAPVRWSRNVLVSDEAVDRAVAFVAALPSDMAE